MRRPTPLAVVAALAVATTTAAAAQPRPSGHVLAPRNAAAPDLSPVSDGGGERERERETEESLRARARRRRRPPPLLLAPPRKVPRATPPTAPPPPIPLPRLSLIYSHHRPVHKSGVAVQAPRPAAGGRKCSDCPWRAPPPTALLPLTLSLLPLPLSPPLDHVHLLLRGHGRRPAGGLLPGRLRGRPLPGAALQRDGDADLGPMRGGAAHQCVHRQLVHRQGQLACGAAA